MMTIESTPAKCISSTNNCGLRKTIDDRVNTFFDMSTTKTFSVMLNAAYAGAYFWPPVKVEGMYDNEIQATTKAEMVSVVAREVY